MTIRILALILLLIAVLPARADLRYELQTLTEHLVLDGGGHLPSGGQVYQPTIVEEFYHELGHQPAWKDRDQAEGVLGILKSSYLEGLNPEDYHYTELMALWALRDDEWPEKDRSRARFDVLLTDGLLLFLRHLAEGKIDPRRLDPTFNYTRLDFEPRRVSTNLRKAIADDEIAAIVDRLRPPQAFYQQMKSALAHYRALDASRSFRPLPTDTVLKPGNSYPVVPALSERLAEMGYLPAGRSALVSIGQRMVAGETVLARLSVETT